MENITIRQSGTRSQRIVDAMRASVARRGSAGSTFDHVAREAGVSRGLLHYYFGTKEQLLVEVVRRDSDLRMRWLDVRLKEARTAEDFLERLVSSLEETVEHDPEFLILSLELFTLARRNEEIAVELAALLRRMREHVAELLSGKQAEGVLRLRAEPEAIAEILFSIADGLALRMLADRGRDFRLTLQAGVSCVRAILADEGPSG